MNQFPQPAVGRLALLSSSLVLLLSSCFNHNTANPPPPSAPKAAVEVDVVSAQPPEPTPTPEAEKPQIDYYQRAITRASSAVAIGQSAQSQDDWSLAAGRWRQAIALLQQVPQDNPNYSVAQQKIKEYQKNLAVTQQQAEGIETKATYETPSSPNGLVANIPIIRRDRGIPVVSAVLEGGQGAQRFTMLFDTGASGTLITPAMANAIGVVIVGETTVEIADGSRVSMPVAYIDSIEVGGLVKESLLVGVGGNVALLGQDFYGEYGVGISQNKINLYE